MAKQVGIAAKHGARYQTRHPTSSKVGEASLPAGKSPSSHGRRGLIQSWGCPQERPCPGAWCLCPSLNVSPC